jgi:translation elongation factor EF-G
MRSTPPFIEIAIEPRSKADQEKLGIAFRPAIGMRA